LFWAISVLFALRKAVPTGRPDFFPVQGGGKMKNKQARNISIAVVITLLASFVVVASLLRPSTLDIGRVDLNTVEDGTYIGICQNKVLFAVVKVEVSGHEIRGIEILEHKKSYLPQAEMIAGDVLAGQSLEVDAISGATLTSDTVKKAIEDALLQGIQ